LSATTLAAFAQPPRNIFITGVITEANAEPAMGVTVVVEGTNYGTVTDHEGKYSLRVSANLPSESTIVFSRLDLETIKERWGGRERIDVRMRVDERMIEGVVVTGILNMHRPDMVASFKSLVADSILMPNYSSIDEMLQGQVAGMMVSMTSMRAGASPQITIRGQSTLLGSGAPLWVVDGIIQPDVQTINGAWDDFHPSSPNMNEIIGSAISWLNPMDIETVTVLKDASATAIYGSRASNGVIVITTKKGTPDRLTIRANYNITIGQQLNYGLYNLMNSQERINFSKEAFEQGVFYMNVPFEQMYTYEGMYNMFLRGRLTEEQFIRQYNFLETVNTDWLDLLTRPSIIHNLGVSASGGSGRTTYRASLSYFKNDATEKGNSSERITANLNTGIEFSSKIRVDANLNASLSNTSGFAVGGMDPIGYATRTSRAIPAYNQDGSPAFYQVRESYKYNENTRTFGLPYNALDDLSNLASTVETPTINASIDFKWKLLPELTWQVVGGANINSRMSETWMGENSFHVIKGYRGYRMGTDDALDPVNRAAAVLQSGGILIHDQTYVMRYNLRNQLNFLRTFGEIHRLTAMVMWEVDSSRRNSKYNTVFGYDRARGERIAAPTRPADLRPIGSATAPSDYVDTYLQYQSGYWRSTNFTENKASLAMIVAYSLMNKYVINANFRNDWSNAFGQNANRRFNPAFSLGASWKLGREEFFDAISDVVNTADIRVTYGTQGNVATLSTSEMVMRFGSLHPIFGEHTSTITRIANPFLTWERTSNWNAGLDLGFFNNALTVVIDGYTRLSNVGRQFNDNPEHGGFFSILTGTYIRNTGFECTINTVPLNTGTWRVSLGANFSKNWNKVVKEEIREAITYSAGNLIAGQTNNIIVPGYALGSFWAYPYAGPHSEYGIPTFHMLDGSYTDAERAMSPTEYLVYAGSRISDITGGISLRINYKKFSLNSQFVAVLGGKGFLFNPYQSFSGGRMPEPVNNMNKELLDRWTPTNRESNIPGLYVVPNEMLNPINLTLPDGTFLSRYDMWAQSDARIVSLSSFRCRNINVSWSLSKEKGVLSSFLQRINMRTLDISAGVNNVFLIADSKWGGMDPELGGDRKSPRSFTFGLNLGF
jgi:TonB-linked SusC/RagA family outer membrane protein